MLSNGSQRCLVAKVRVVFAMKGFVSFVIEPEAVGSF